jgi:hypothetical protein
MPNKKRHSSKRTHSGKRQIGSLTREHHFLIRNEKSPGTAYEQTRVFFFFPLFFSLFSFPFLIPDKKSLGTACGQTRFFFFFFSFLFSFFLFLFDTANSLRGLPLAA